MVSPLTQPFHNLSHHAWGLYLHRSRAPRRIGQVLRFPLGIHRHLLKAKVAVLKQKSRHRKSCLEDVRIMIDLNRPWKALTFNALIRKLIAKLWRPIKTSSFNDDYAMIMVCSLKRCLSFWYKSNLWASIGYLFQLRHTQNASGEFEARNWQLTRPEHLVYDAVSVVLACWGIAS